jgi:hypothetical protein
VDHKPTGAFSFPNHLELLIMKKTILLVALLAAGVAQAQDLSADSRAQSAAGAAAQSGSVAAGNVVVVDQRGPTSQTLNQTLNQNVSGTTRAEQILSGSTTSNDNVRYSGTVENRTSGGTYNTLNENVAYSGTQTIKNVPGIAMSGPASGPCTGASGGIGLAGPGWGVGLNGSAVMVDCRLRENSRVLGMAMQSFDGAANPQEKGEVTVMFMDSLRALAGYNDKLVADEKIVVRGKAK